MTLAGKIGQTTWSAGLAVTGPGGPVDHLPAIRAGALGSAIRCGSAQTRTVEGVALA